MQNLFLLLCFSTSNEKCKCENLLPFGMDFFCRLDTLWQCSSLSSEVISSCQSQLVTERKFNFLDGKLCAYWYSKIRLCSWIHQQMCFHPIIQCCRSYNHQDRLGISQKLMDIVCRFWTFLAPLCNKIHLLQSLHILIQDIRWEKIELALIW